MIFGLKKIFSYSIFGKYSFLILDECLRTQPSSYYWLSVLPMEGTNAKWIYSEEDSFVISTTNDGGSNWDFISNNIPPFAYISFP